MNPRILSLVLFLSPHGAFAGGNVNVTSVGFTPITDLGTGTYLGSPGGLYPGSSNSMPASHQAAGAVLAAQIQPLDASGAPSPTGKIGILTTGMSNANQIFGKVGELMAGQWAPNVVFINGAQGGMDAAIWANPTHVVWTNAQSAVTAAGLTSAQVQVVLNYHAVAHAFTPPQPWPLTPQDLQNFQESIAGHLRTKYPNTKLSFWGTREYGGFVTGINNPEPYAYQSAFAVKWMIERQINGTALNYDPGLGPVTSPWMAWGPYLWADGVKPRGDGLFYEPRDFQSDGTHPTMRGRSKQAWPWVHMLRTDALTASWAVPAGNRSPVCAITFPQDNIETKVGPTVALQAFAEDEDSGIQRVEFYHGATLLGTDTVSPFTIAWLHPGVGDYLIHAVAFDNAGATRNSNVITAKIRLPMVSTTNLADDTFESTDLNGGAGWTTTSWIQTGTPTTTSTTAASGLWSAELDGGDSIARSLSLASTSGVNLAFSWRGTIAAGGTFTVEVRDTVFHTVFTQTTHQPAWTTITIPLGAYLPSSTFGLRIRATGVGTLVNVDNIFITTATTGSGPATAPNVDIVRTPPGNFLLQWPAKLSTFYRVEESTDLAIWTTSYHASGDETSAMLLERPWIGTEKFYRVELVTP